MIRARIERDEETGLNRWVLRGRFSVGSWGGPPPRGAVYLKMGWLNLFTGEYRLFAPKGVLP